MEKQLNSIRTSTKYIRTDCIIIASPRNCTSDFLFDTLSLTDKHTTDCYHKKELEAYGYIIYTKGRSFDFHAYIDEYEALRPLMKGIELNIQKKIIETTILAYEGFYHQNLYRYRYDKVRQKIVSEVVEHFYEDPITCLNNVMEKINKEPCNFCIKEFLKSGFIIIIRRFNRRF